jgi:phage recombination protein Bet
MAETATALKPVAAVQSHSLIRKIAARYEVDPERMLRTLKDTAFKATDRSGQIIDVTNEQMLALLVVADQYKLNPFTRELYAFPAKGGGIVPIVSIDGWIRIVNEHPQFNGVEFKYGYEEAKLAWIEAVMFRRDRDHPITVRELMLECVRPTEPWKQTPSRMLRHRAYIQCARYAFGFAGIFDPEEGAAILAGEASRIPEASPEALEALNRELGAKVRGNGKPAEQRQSDPAPTGEPPASSGLGESISGPAAAASEPGAAGGNAPAESASPGFVRELIAKADSIERLDEARDLIRFVQDEQARAELDVEERAKRKQLG